MPQATLSKEIIFQQPTFSNPIDLPHHQLSTKQKSKASASPITRPNAISMTRCDQMCVLRRRHCEACETVVVPVDIPCLIFPVDGPSKTSMLFSDGGLIQLGSSSQVDQVECRPMTSPLGAPSNSSSFFFSQDIGRKTETFRLYDIRDWSAI